jgi:GNAT superfamily N-acetyltransferase
MTTPPAFGIRDIQLIEQAEAEYFRRFLAGASDDVAATLGIRTAHIGDGMAAAMVEDPTGTWTKAMGFGFDRLVDDALVTDVLDFFRAAGRKSGRIAIAPAVMPENWEEIRSKHGLVGSSSWTKFACRVDDFVPGTTDLEMRELTDGDVDAWARIIRDAFGMSDPDLTPLLAGTIADPAARVFGTWDGDLLVGAGAVHIFGETASFNTGGTLPSHRGRGVQSALIAVRAAAAAEAGCRLFTAETGASAEKNVSHRNLERSGFTPQYDRINWLWQE